MAPIVANRIVYADHDVVCDPDCYSPAYMADMEECLTEGGTMAQHKKELNDHNNDGTWTVWPTNLTGTRFVRHPVAFTKQDVLWVECIGFDGTIYTVVMRNYVSDHPGAIWQNVKVSGFDAFETKAHKLFYEQCADQREARERHAIANGTAVQGAYL